MVQALSPAMDARFLDMLEDARDHDIVAVANRVDIHLDGIAQIAVDQHRRIARDDHGGLDVIFQLRLRIDNLHRPPAKHVGWPHQHRIADACRQP